ncbi:unnamed protein product [Phaeothamnion confervicola]
MLMVGLLGLLATSSNAQESKLAQAQPMLVVLRASRDGDVKLFKSAFSKAVLEEAKTEKRDWKELSKSTYAALKKEFVAYKLADFTFYFAGNDQGGDLTVFFKGKPSEKIQVVHEANGWKLNEH